MIDASEVREDDEVYMQALHGAKTQIRSWQFADRKRHKDFMKHLLEKESNTSDQSEETEVE